MPESQSNFFMDFIDFNKSHLLTESLQPAYYQLGFMCNVQALPELIDLERWLAYLWCNGKVSFENESQAIEYAQTVLSLTADIANLYENAVPLDLLDCTQWVNEKDIVSENAINFATGFLAAVEVFDKEWAEIEKNETAQNMLQTTILLLTKLTKNEHTPPELLALFEQLPENAEILKILPSLISNLAYSASQSSH